MTHRFARIRQLFGFTAIAIAIGGCAMHREAATISASDITSAATGGKKLIGEADRGWLRYKFYAQILPAQGHRGHNSDGSLRTELSYSIMVVNMQDGASPLRKLSQNLDQYNIYYEYLLNQTKNDLSLVVGDQILYPVYYAFENNYNAFPFETINVGYRPAHPFSRKVKNSQSARLIYADKIFAHDTVSCPVNL